MKRILGIAVGLALAGSASASATFMCGSSACSNVFLAAECGNNGCGPGAYGVITGVDDVKVGHALYDVTFSTSGSAAPRGGLSAFEAILGSVAITGDPGLTGPSMFVSLNGDQTWVSSFQVGSKPKVLDEGVDIYKNSGGIFIGSDERSPVIGDGGPPATSCGPVGGVCTVWTKVTAAPELAPGSLVGALTLLAGGIAVMAGSRRRSASQEAA